MPDSIVRQALQEVTPLRDSDPIGYAARRVRDANLPALPVVDENGVYVGLFGEREFMEAMFPGYVGTLASARMIRRSIDETIERRIGCQADPIFPFLTRDEVVVEDDYADTHLAETFLHHRVLVVPIATNGKVHAVVTRRSFFEALLDRLGDMTEDYGD